MYGVSILTKDNIVKILPKTSQHSFKPILVTNSTIKNNQQEQDRNGERDIPVGSEHQVPISSITTFLVILCSPEYIIPPSTHETTNMRALDVQQ